MASPDVVLYRLRPEWGLPSLSIGCVQVEAYLRLAKVRFAVHDCASGSASPTGQVPALDTSEDLVGADAGAPPADDLAAAKAQLAYLRRTAVDLDRWLSASQRAEALAFAALIETKLQPALVYSTWCEPAAYAAHTRPAYGAALPFPLSFLLPRAQRKAVAARLAGAAPAGRVYAEAEAALDAIAARMAANTSGGFFFGAQPSSLDALVFGCLAYVRAAPVVHAELRRRMEAHPSLSHYVNRLAADQFASEVPRAADADLSWSQRAPGGATGGGAAGERYSKRRSQAEVEQARKARWWLAGAAAAVAAYVVFSGEYMALTEYIGELGEDDDGGDE